MAAQEQLSVRDAMTKLIAVLDEVGDDLLSAEKEIVVAMQDLMTIPGLDAVATQSNTGQVAPGKPTTGLLYYDGEYRLVRGMMPAGCSPRLNAFEATGYFDRASLRLCVTSSV